MLLVLFAFTVSGVAEMKVWEGGYVPAPEPVKSGVSLGVYIFPGWYRDKGRGDYPYKTHDEDSEWKLCVAKQPGPRPLLGFYDDSLPEVNDWHIKWAVEHGISWFSFDWYWNAGEKKAGPFPGTGIPESKIRGYDEVLRALVQPRPGLEERREAG